MRMYVIRFVPLQNKLPDFNVEDAAMLERLLCVPHRARFFQGDVPPENFSYHADPNIKTRFGVWAPYFLRWQIRGLLDYHNRGFKTIPDSCRKYKLELLADKDMVQEFLKETVVEGEASDVLKAKELYNEFEATHKGPRKSKPMLRYKEFQSGLERVLQKRLKSRHTVMVDGKQQEVTSALLGYRHL